MQNYTSTQTNVILNNVMSYHGPIGPASAVLTPGQAAHEGT